MEITLRPITKDNWRQVVWLTPKRNQLNWVSSNWYSLLELLFEKPHRSAMGIYRGDKAIGFVLYGFEDNRYWIIRFMIDKKSQKRGYGRIALGLIIQTLWNLPDCQQIYLSFVPDNHPARDLYASIGFIDTGEIDDDEIVYRLDKAT